MIMFIYDCSLRNSLFDRYNEEMIEKYSKNIKLHEFIRIYSCYLEDRFDNNIIIKNLIDNIQLKADAEFLSNILLSID